MKKPFFRVFDLVRHKLGCTATENGQTLEIMDIETHQDILFTRQQKVGFLMMWLILF